MANLLCSSPGMTTSQEESTSPRIRCAGVPGAPRTARDVVGRERPGEHAQRGQQALLPGAEQVITCPHDVDEPAALRLAAGLGVEQHRPLGEDLGHRQGADPARDQLDGQRQAIEAAAQLRDGVRCDVGAGEARHPLVRPGDEQPHRVAGRDVGGARRGGGALQRRDGPAHLAGHAEHDPAGDHDPQPVRGGEQLAGQLRDRGTQVLRAVEQQQPRCRRQRRGQALLQAQPGLIAYPQAVRHRRDQRGRLAHRFERDERHLGRRAAPANRLDGQPGLPGAARANQADQPGRRDDLTQLGEFAGPADEARLGDRQPGRGRAVGGGTCLELSQGPRASGGPAIGVRGVPG